MATLTWLGKQSLHADVDDATDPLNWVGGLLPQTGDTVIVAAGSAGSGVALNLVSQGGTIHTVDTNTLQVAGPFDTLTFGGVVMNATTLTAGDGAAAGQGFVLNLTDSAVDGLVLSVGNHATLNLTGTTSSAMRITSEGGQSVIVQTGTGSALTATATGTADLDAEFWLGAAGGQAVFNVAQLGTVAGFLQSTGPILNLGGTLTFNGDGNTGTRFSNAGYLLVAGLDGAALDRLNARMNGISGELNILGGAHGATLDVATNMPGAQIVNFGDADGLLRIEASATLAAPFDVTVDGTATPTNVLQNFFSRIVGFRPGNTIRLAGLDPAGLGYSYGNDPDYGNGVLTISRGAAVVARLRFQGTSLVAGTGTIDGAATGNFQLTSAGGDTLVTLANAQQVVDGGTTIAVTGSLAVWNGVTDGATLDWSAANWTGGTAGGLPGQYQAAQITLTAAQLAAVRGGGFPQYVLTVNTAATAGSLSFDDPLATLSIAAPLTLSALPGQPGGGGFLANQGKVAIRTGGTLATARAYVGHGSDLTIEPGGRLAMSGAVGFTLGSGLAGLDVEGYGQVAGGTIAATANIVVGQNGNGALSVSNDVVSNNGTAIVYGSQGARVTATYTQVGGSALTGAEPPLAVLDIGGAQTSYADVGGDATTPLSGALVVGGGNLSVNALGQILYPNGGNGLVNVHDGATLSEANFAMLGATRISSGTVNLSGGAQWLIGSDGAGKPDAIVAGGAVTGTATLWSGGLPWLTVGAGGTGLVNVNSSVVQLGTGEAFNTLKVMLGGGSTSNNLAFGSVDVRGVGALLDSGGGPMVVGHRGSGQLTIGNGGTVRVGSAAATTLIDYGLSVGNRSGTVGLSSGLVSIDPGGVLVDDGSLVVGRESPGTFTMAGGHASVSGGLYMGGQLALSNGTVAITPTLFRGGATGFLNVGGGTLDVAGNVAAMWQGSSILLSGDGAIAIGGTPAAGELVIGSGAVLQGAGFISVANAGAILRNDGTIIAGGLTSNGAPSQIGTTLDIGATLVGGGTYLVADGGTLRLASAVPNQARFGFIAGGTLEESIRVVTPTAFQGEVSGFYGSTRHVILPGATAMAGSQLTYAENPDPTSGGTLSLSTSLGAVSFTVTGWHPGGFTAGADFFTGTVITAVDAAPCFAAGTMILTEAGERPVESLRPGALVPVLGGRLARIVWVGRTRVALGRHPAPDSAAPVRIRAGALADGVPHRDLVVSPDHALWTDGVLVPAYLLVNDATVVREPAVGTMTYVHVELERHGLMLAEGAPAESYLDTGNRGQFAGEPGARGLHPDMTGDASARAWDERACAVLSLGGPGVVAAHRRIAARARALGHALSDDPALTVAADGRELGRIALPGGRVLVPAGTGRVTLLSRSAVPQALDAACRDGRRLGVAVAGIRFAGRQLALSGAAIGAGFHALDRAGATALRWTDGAAELRLPPLPEPAWLELVLVPGLLRYVAAA